MITSLVGCSFLTHIVFVFSGWSFKIPVSSSSTAIWIHGCVRWSTPFAVGRRWSNWPVIWPSPNTPSRCWSSFSSTKFNPPFFPHRNRLSFGWSLSKLSQGPRETASQLGAPSVSTCRSIGSSILRKLSHHRSINLQQVISWFFITDSAFGTPEDCFFQFSLLLAFANWSFDWLIACLLDVSIDRLVGRSVGWLIDWLIIYVVFFSVLSAELLLQFFTFYASFPFTNHVMSCFSGEVIPIESFPVPEDGFKLRYVNLQDPFDLAHNIAKSVGLPTFTAFREFLRQEVCVFSQIPLDLVVLFNIDYTAPDLPPSPVMVSISASRKFPVKEDSSWGPKVADLTQKMLLEFFRCEFVREMSAEDFGEQKGFSFRYWICFKIFAVVEFFLFDLGLMSVFAFWFDFTVIFLLTYLVQWIIYFLFCLQGLFPSAAAFISWARLWKISTAGWSVGAGPNDVTFANNWPKTCNSPRSRRSGTWKWPSENASIRLPIKAAPLISTSPSWSTRWKRKKCAFRCRARSKRMSLRELSSRLIHCIDWLIDQVWFSLRFLFREFFDILWKFLPDQTRRYLKMDEPIIQAATSGEDPSAIKAELNGVITTESPADVPGNVWFVADFHKRDETHA